MKYIKISNLLNQFDQPDYKGLDLDEIVAGSQVYNIDTTVFIGATNEDEIPSHDDIELISEEEYVVYKQQFREEISNMSASTEERLELMEKAIDDIILGGM